MVSKRRPYKTYTKEFKLEALRLMNVTGSPAAEIAKNLDQIPVLANTRVYLTVKVQTRSDKSLEK